MMASFHAFAQLPTPRLDSIFPAEVQIGGEIEVTLSGTELSDASALIFDAAGIVATKVDALRFHVVAPPGTTPAVVEARAVTRLGVTDGHPFVIGADRVVVGTNKNQQMTGAFPVELPCAVHGRAEPEQRHYYRFQAQMGETLRIACTAFHLDSPMDPVMTVLDPTGRTLQCADDENDRDATLTWSPPRTGEFVIEVHDKTFAGGAAYQYRLSIAQANADPSETFPYQGTQRGTIAQTVPELGESEPNNTRETAQLIPLPVTVKGQFDDDYFVFEGDPARPLWIEVASEGAEGGADPVVIVEKISRNPSGAEESKQVAELDDQSALPTPPFWQTGSLDCAGKFVPDEKARFRIFVRDRFGGHAGYRLRVTDGGADFAVVGLAECPANEEKKIFRWQPNVRRGGSAYFHVAARRRNYDGEITLGAAGLPPDVHASGTIPAGAASGVLAFYADESAKPWAGFVRVFADGGGVMREVECLSYRWSVDNRDNQRLALRSGRVAIGVADEPAPITIRAAETKTWEAAIGSKLEIPLQLGFPSADIRAKGEWQIVPLGIPGLKKTDVVKLDTATATKATLVVNLQKEGNALQPGTFILWPRASGTVAYKENPKAKTRDLKDVEFGEPVAIRLTAPAVAVSSAK
jgi:hypothetical protein